jgi:hypothetical protein
MGSARGLDIDALKALIELSEIEQERLHAILDDDSEDGDIRANAMEQLARVLQNHRQHVIQLAEFESAQ